MRTENFSNQRQKGSEILKMTGGVGISTSFTSLSFTKKISLIKQAGFKTIELAGEEKHWRKKEEEKNC